ncbi:uncharacterized protein [Magallana gigas]|uniref:uncharacterized protein n=1 Tax=Magallana gigas TaxID=29159 RepID=UPI00333F6ADE
MAPARHRSTRSRQKVNQIPKEERVYQGDAVAVLLDGGVWWPACSLAEKKVKFWSDEKVKSGQKTRSCRSKKRAQQIRHTCS